MFWDLYCAVPERRNQFEASDEAKVFHDYVSSFFFLIVIESKTNSCFFLKSANQQTPANNPMMIPGQQNFARFHSAGSRNMRMPPNADYNNPANPNAGNAPSATTPTSGNQGANPQMNIDPARGKKP